MLYSLDSCKCTHAIQIYSLLDSFLNPTVAVSKKFNLLNWKINDMLSLELHFKNSEQVCCSKIYLMKTFGYGPRSEKNLQKCLFSTSHPWVKFRFYTKQNICRERQSNLQQPEQTTTQEPIHKPLTISVCVWGIYVMRHMCMLLYTYKYIWYMHTHIYI